MDSAVKAQVMQFGIPLISAVAPLVGLIVDARLGDDARTVVPVLEQALDTSPPRHLTVSGQR